MAWKTKRTKFKGKGEGKEADKKKGTIDIEELFSLLPSEGDEATAAPTLTTQSVWAVGDRCQVRGLAGIVDSLGPECASVTIPGTNRMLFVGLDELTPALGPDSLKFEIRPKTS